MKKILAATIVVLASAVASAMSPIPANHPWKGKKVAFLGDSITDKRQQNRIYWQFLEEWLQVKAYVYGISGNRWSHILGQAEKVKAECPDVDAIVIMIGTNDYNGSEPLGEWFSVVDEPVNFGGNMTVRHRRYPNFERDTVRGNANLALAYMKREFPDAQVVLLTPIHRAYAWLAERNIQPDERYANALGLYIDDYVKVVKEAANLWAVTAVDLNALCGLFPLEESNRKLFRCTREGADPRFTDYLHPNTDGHRRIAETLMLQFSVIPCGFRAAE